VESLVSIIDNYKVLVCAGTGGVGKTSISAAIGFAAVQRGKRVLVLTVDPAKRLKTALGLQDLDSEEYVELKLSEATKGKFFAATVNAKQVFDRFVTEASSDSESAKLLLNNMLYKKLSMGLQGSQEFTSLEKFYSAYQSNKFDLIIVDTPPSQHAVDFLEAPERLNKLFDESILKWFISEKESGFKMFNKVLRTGTRKAFGVLERLTGSEFVEEIFNFFVSMKGIRKALVERNQKINQLLHSPEVGFLLVTAYEEAKLNQAIDFYHRLEKNGFNFVGSIINRSLPKPERLGVSESPQVKRDYYYKIAAHYEKEEKAYSKLEDLLGDNKLHARLFEVVGEQEPLRLIQEMSRQIAGRADV
jgi:anion-transporting  ArsA/GET3 family ATPase